MHFSNFSPTINMINLGVDCLHTSKNFYEQQFNWQALDLGKKNYVIFSFDGVYLGLYPLDQFESALKIPKSSSKFNGIALSINVPNEKAISHLVSKTVCSGGNIIQDLKATDWGGHHAFISDPDDYLIEIVYNPKWTLDASGKIIIPNMHNQ